jgi:hypothetical protein
MIKHNQKSGFHIMALAAAELVISTLAITFWLKNGINLNFLLFVVPFVLFYIILIITRSIVHQIPTALGYGDLAIANTKKAAQSTKNIPAPKIYLNLIANKSRKLVLLMSFVAANSNYKEFRN